MQATRTLAVFAAVLALLAAVPSTNASNFDANDASTWAAALGSRFTLLRNTGLGVNELQQEIDATVYTSETVDGATAFSSLLATVTAKVESSVNALFQIVNAANAAFVEDKASAGTFAECCRVQPNEYLSLFKSKVDVTTMCMRYASPLRNADTTRDTRVLSNLRSTYSDNFGSEPTLKWQYFGTRNGVYSIFPSARSSSCTSYDPRLRPWYVVAATPEPRSIVIVIDTSGSMSGTRIELARAAAQTVLSTANPNDEINVVLFSSTPQYPSGCFSSTMAEATPQNLERLQNFVATARAGGGTYYSSALSRAWSLLATAKHKRMVLFMSDGEPSDTAAMRNTLQRLRQTSEKTYLLTFAFGTRPDPVKATLQTMAAENFGEYTFVPDGGDLRGAMGRYYEFFTAAPNGEEDPVWTTPYFDFSGLGVVTTVAAPLFIDGQLIGVGGVDVTLTDIFGSATFFGNAGDLSYGFLIDAAGRVLAHPSLTLPDEVEDDPVFVDIELLERDSDFASIRTAMLNRATGSKTITVERALPRGDGRSEGVRIVEVTATYHYAPIPRSPFVLCLVFAQQDSSRLRLSTSNSGTPGTMYHESDRLEDVARCKYLGSTVLAQANSTVKFAPGLFQDPALAIEMNPSADDVRAINRFLQDGAHPNTLPYELRLRDPPQVLDDVAMTHILDSFWSDVQAPYAVWNYVATRNGVFRINPGVVLNASYDPTLRPWFLRGIANEGALALSTPYVDANGAGVVVTMSEAVYHTGSDRLLAVLGMDFKLGQLGAILDAETRCKDRDARCVLLDDNGFVVYDDKYLLPAQRPLDISSHYVGKLFPGIASFLEDNNLLIPSTCVAYEKQMRERFMLFKTNVGTVVGSAPCRSGGQQAGKFALAPIAGTNLYLLVVEEKAACGGIAFTGGPKATNLNVDVCTGDLLETITDPTCPPETPSSASAPPADPKITGKCEFVPDVDCSSIKTVQECSAVATCVAKVDYRTEKLESCDSIFSDNSAQRTHRVALRIILRSQLISQWTQAKQDDLVSAIASGANVGRDRVEIVRVAAGSVVVDARINELDPDTATAIANGVDASIVPPSLGSATVSATSESSSGSDSSGGGGGSGGAVAAVIVTLFVIGALLFAYRRYKRKQARQHLAHAGNLASVDTPRPPPSSAPAPPYAPSTTPYAPPTAPYAPPTAPYAPSAEAPPAYSQFDVDAVQPATAPSAPPPPNQPFFFSSLNQNQTNV
eukprot:m.85448 g.85448  ORF g.85448 m.85448 type:complete len:1229 (+) comp8386_c0_seq1:956-4642(+)